MAFSPLFLPQNLTVYVRVHTLPLEPGTNHLKLTRAMKTNLSRSLLAAAAKKTDSRAPKLWAIRHHGRYVAGWTSLPDRVVFADDPYQMRFRKFFSARNWALKRTDQGYGLGSGWEVVEVAPRADRFSTAGVVSKATARAELRQN